MSRPLRVAIICGEVYGSDYYRAKLVKRAIDRWGEALGVEAIYADRWHQAFSGVDVAHFVRATSTAIPIEAFHGLKRAGVGVSIDIDDAFLDLERGHPSWETSQCRSFRHYHEALIKAADVITFSTRTIAERHEPLMGSEAKGRVIPNAFDSDMRFLRLGKDAGLGVVGSRPLIGWFGGAQHALDLEPLAPLWDALLARGYGLVFIGAQPPAIEGRGPGTGERIAVHSGINDAERFFQLIAATPIHVGLAPLSDTVFNRCKSALKPLEYRWLCGVPCVASAVEPYDKLVCDDDADGLHLVDGFGVGAWLEAIERALENVRAEGRRHALPEAYRLKNTVDGWADAFRLAARIAGNAIGYMGEKTSDRDRPLVLEGKGA